jgi:hypothetical protein
MTRLSINTDVDWKTRFVEIFAFESPGAGGISELIGNDPGPADFLIVTFMCMAIDP